MSMVRKSAPAWVREKRRRLACEVSCPVCAKPKGQRCGVAGGFHEARSDYAYQVRRTRGR